MFSVMTYNIGNGLAPTVMLAEALKQANADVVGLQEVTPDQATFIQHHLAADYAHIFVRGLGIPGKALLSRYPLTAARLLPLIPDRPDLYAEITIEGQPLLVLVAHPLPPRLQRTGFHFKPETRQQIMSLARTASSAEAAIIMGDFNMIATHPLHHEMRRIGYEDAFLISGAGRGATFPRRINRIPALPLLRIDYIWYSCRLRPLHTTIGPDGGSDHLPVVSLLDWA